MNINSLRRKRDVVIKYIEDVKPLIIAISETWLDPNFSTSHVQIDGYNLVRNYRGLKNKNKTRYMQAGGVACYIHRSLTFKVLFMSKISLYLVPYGATNFSNNATTSIDIAFVDSSSKLVSFSKTDSPIAAGHLAINLVYKFVADKISNKSVTYRNFRNCDKKRCL